MKELTSDIIIVAAGASGLAAAVQAAELGNKVISFEKGATTGGTGNMGMGPLAVESRLQREKQIGLTREEAFKIFMDYTHWRVDARLVKTYIDKSASTIDWLESLGVEFTEPAAYFAGSNFTWHLVKPPTGRPGPQSSGTMMKILTDNAKDLGVQFYLQTPVTKILKENGKVVGVEAKSATGEEYVVKAKAVIVGTGGFGDSPELIKKHTGYDWGKNFFSFRVPGLVGDGIRMAWEAGAGDTEFSMEMIYGMPNIMEIDLTNLFRQPNLMVNLLGERFINEEIMGNTTFTGNAIARQKNNTAFIIFDDAIKQHYVDVGLDLTSLVHPGNKLTDIDNKLKKMFDEKYEYAFVADSIDELASKTGINAANLKATIEEYNQSCETGRDLVMNKKTRYLRPIAKPKFYAGKFYPGAYGSLGGIKMNYKCEVLTKDFETIPGLYACGTDACTIYGDSYVFVLPGNTMGFALNTGRMAAENATQYIKSLK